MNIRVTVTYSWLHGVPQFHRDQPPLDEVLSFISVFLGRLYFELIGTLFFLADLD